MKLNFDCERPISKIKTLNDLAGSLDVKIGHLLYIAYERTEKNNYKSFFIKKKNGGLREIHAPQKGLAIIQKKIATLLSENVIFKNCVTGFVTGEGIYKNAHPHRKSAWVLNIDIEDFFGSISFARVRAVLIAAPFVLDKKVATVIAQLCTHNGKLPQGAPSSPVIANIVASMLDNAIIRMIKRHHLRYTRYADDISISSRKAFPPTIAHFEDGKTIVGDKIYAAFQRSGFKVNTNKSRLQSKYNRQESTGLVINKKVNVPVEFKNKLRAAIHQWTISPEDAEKKFLQSQNLEKNDDTSGEKLRNNIYGRLSHISMIKGKDDPTFIKLALKMAEYAPSPPKFIANLKKEYKVYDIFICHASEDKTEIAEPLYTELNKLGLNVFIDTEEIGWGDSLVDVINKALQKSKYVVAIMSKHSIGKSWPQKEIHAVLSNEISKGNSKLLPLINGDADIILSENYLLSDKLYKNWEKNPTEIAAELKKMVEGFQGT